jgi:putative DNA primase/helicase
MLMNSARGIVAALGGRWFGSYGLARCPAHEDRSPSLSVTERAGKLLVRCHTGCAQLAVIDALKKRGLWYGRSSDTSPPRAAPPGTAVEAGYNQDRIGAARRIWVSSLPAAGTPVAEYLRSRAIDVPLPPTIKFHPRLAHPSGSHFAAMVGGVAIWPASKITGVHRTYLGSDAQGWGKAAVEPNKMMLGRCRGGSVRLAAHGPALMLGEGIETCLSAMQATGIPAWAALSAGGLRGVLLPADVTSVIVLADGDEPGEAAAHDAAMRWKREGRGVRIARPPRGTDFNDLLMGMRPPIGANSMYDVSPDHAVVLADASDQRSQS